MIPPPLTIGSSTEKFVEAINFLLSMVGEESICALSKIEELTECTEILKPAVAQIQQSIASGGAIGSTGCGCESEIAGLQAQIDNLDLSGGADLAPVNARIDETQEALANSPYLACTSRTFTQ